METVWEANNMLEIKIWEICKLKRVMIQCYSKIQLFTTLSMWQGGRSPTIF